MRPRVETRDGLIEGVEERGIRIFRGIPYARPPVGKLRWRPPQPPEPWSGVRDASRFGPAAPQNGSMLMRFQGLTDLPQSEDCLTLNVWTPGPDGGRRPVLVWVHGGGFRSGTAAEPIYQAAELARRADAVVVTFNYRLGALGFLALSPHGDEPGANFGLLDQVAALEWVREHAACFGGDPERVMLFGQSAGAMSVATLLGVERARPLFRTAILQSGAADNVSPLGVAERIAEIFLKEVGLSRDQREELRALPLEAVLAAQQRTAERSARYVSLTFQPCVDGRVIQESPLAQVAGGATRDIPLVIGTNLEEWNLFGLADARSRSLDEKRLRRRLERIRPGEEGDPLTRVRALYGDTAPGGEAWTPATLWYAIESDRYFHLPALRLALAQAAHGRVYKYLFTWRSPAVGGVLGACHGLELPFVFGTLRQPILARFAGQGEAAEALAARIQAAWGAFARSRTPEIPDLGLWPAYEPARRATLCLSGESRIEQAPLEDRARFWESEV